MSRVFISYRRSDSADWAARIYKHLGYRYGNDLIFQDVEDIEPGNNWLEKIKEELEACQVFLIIIGPRWLEDADGIRRLDNPKDILRLEIEQALNHDKILIPVLVGEMKMPESEDLPESLNPMHYKQAVSIQNDQWNDNVELFIEQLREIILPTIDLLSLPEIQKELSAMQFKYFDQIDKSWAALTILFPILHAFKSYLIEHPNSESKIIFIYLA